MKPVLHGTLAALAMGLLALAGPGAAGFAQTAVTPSGPSYADLADLSDSAQFVFRAQVRKLARVDARQLRAPVAPGRGRFFVTARTQALLTGLRPLPVEVAYLADLPVDARGRPLLAKKSLVLVFAREAPGGQLQLVAPDAQIPWSSGSETTLRSILLELVSPDAPPRITGVREVIYVPGNLRGEGETQVFLSSRGNAAASLAVRHRPSTPTSWGVSFSELAADSGNAPARDTLAWYRLACFLPAEPPPGANRSANAEERAQAASDYRFVLAELGECPRTRR